MDEILDNDGMWGARFNRTTDNSSRKRNQLPDGCPTWANSHQIDEWKKVGLICWNNESKKLSHLNGTNTLALIKLMRETSEWIQQGIPIQHLVNNSNPDNHDSPSEGKKVTGISKTTDKEPSQQIRYTSRWIEDLRLPAQAGPQLIALLERNEVAIKELAELEEQTARQALAEIYKILINGYLSSAAKRVDLSKYSLKWQFDEKLNQLICDLPSKRATVIFNAQQNTWGVDIEEQDKPVWTVDFFSTPESALKWAEEQLQKDPPILAPRPRQRTALQWAQELKTVYRKKWIDPKSLEPKNITYCVALRLSLKAITFKSIRWSFGGWRQVDDQFPSPLQVEKTLKLHPNYFAIERLFHGLYEAHSVTAFRDVQIAQTEAACVWAESEILASLRSEQLLYAQYGIREKETGYSTWIGECGNADGHFDAETDRSKYMLHQAVVTTLEATLDVKRYRHFLRLRDDVFDDDLLLKIMHEHRVTNQFLSAELRAESSAWLVLNQEAKKHRNNIAKETEDAKPSKSSRKKPVPNQAKVVRKKTSK